MKNPLPLFFTLLVCLSACGPGSLSTTQKAAPNDPYLADLPLSQLFEVNADQDTLLEGAQGTLIVLPAGCFLDTKGEVYTLPVKIELAEAYQVEDMLFANLTTTSDGKPLETGGMFFWNPTSLDGAQLQVNPEIPVYIEVPAQGEARAGMQAYRGIRDADGNMDWVDPTPLYNDLVTVDLDLLNFYPPGYEKAVDRGLPFRGHKVADRQLKDSLFYAMAIADPKGFYQASELDLNWNVTGSGTSDSTIEAKPNTVEVTCGINPASIKVIRGKDYQQTFIATRAFETRLQDIYRANEQAILDIYIQGLDRNLSDCDQEAATHLSAKPIGKKFEAYASERQGKVMDAEAVARMLKKHYQRQLKATQRKLEKMKAKALDAARKKDAQAEARFQAYSRELGIAGTTGNNRYRLMTTQVGWINIDKPLDLSNRVQGELVDTGNTLPISFGTITVKVPNASDLDQADVFVVTDGVTAIGRFESKGGDTYSLEESAWSFLENGSNNLYFIGRKGDEKYFGQTKFDLPTTSVTIEASVKSKAAIRKEIAQSREERFSNSQAVAEFNYLNELVENEKEGQDRIQESRFLSDLYHVVKPACGDAKRGLALFQENCAVCHNRKLCTPSTGPALAGVTERRQRSWLHLWTRNSLALLAEGDPEAVQIWEENNKAAQPAMPHLSPQDLKDIYTFIQQFSQDCPPTNRE